MAITERATRSKVDATHIMKEYRCFFCNDNKGVLHRASTSNLNEHIKNCVLELNDSLLLAKISSAGDVMALEVKYHGNCLTNLYNRVRAARRTKERVGRSVFELNESLAYAELVSYINESNRNSDISPVFKLSELTKLYSDRLCVLKVKETGSFVHSRRLQDRLLASIPDLYATKVGKHNFLAFRAEMGTSLIDACKLNGDSDAMCLAKAAEIVRRDLFQPTKEFTGSFEKQCENESVRTALLSLIQMIIEGPSIADQTEKPHNEAALSIAQLIKYNSIKHQRDPTTKTVRHNRNQETPLPIYILVYWSMQKRGRKV